MNRTGPTLHPLPPAPTSLPAPDWARKRGIPLEVAERICDPWWFIPRMRIIDKNNKERQIGRLNYTQSAVLNALLRSERVCVLKARQVYVSTITVAFFAWLSIVRDEGYRTFCLTDSGDTVSSLNDMYRNFYTLQPPRFTHSLLTDNATEIELPNGSRSRQKMAGGKGQGRSFTYQGLHCTEVGFWPRTSSAHGGRTALDAKAIRAARAALSATDPWRRQVFESTAAGPGGLFHETVQLAQRSREWAFVFVPWFVHPEYKKTPPPGWQRTTEEHQLATRHNLSDDQLCWRRMKIVDESYGLEGFMQEYPSTPEEPFLVSSGMWFNTLLISEHRGLLRYDEHAAKEDMYVVHPYIPGRRYFVGCDTAGGTGGDFATAIVVRDDMVVCARWMSNRASPTAQAEVFAQLGAQYGNASCLVEYNTKHGKYVVRHLEDVLMYSNLWKSRDAKDWTTNRVTKRMIYAYLRDAVDHQLLDIDDPLVLDELVTIREQEDGDIRADGTGHDDLCDALALACWAGRDTFNVAQPLRIERQAEDRLRRFKDLTMAG